MAGGWAARLEGAVFGPLRRERWPGDLAFAVFRERRRVVRVGILIEVVGLVLTVILMGVIDVRWFLPGVAGSIAAAAAVTVVLSRRRSAPAAEVVAFGIEQALARWERLDGGPPPDTADRGLLRLGDRSRTGTPLTTSTGLPERGSRRR